MTTQKHETKNYIKQFLCPEQTKLLSYYINKEVKWEDDKNKIQTYSKYSKFGCSINNTYEFPLWAVMVSKKLYYEKAIDFVPDEVTVFEQTNDTICDIKSIINEAKSNSVVIILEVSNSSLVSPGNLIVPSFFIDKCEDKVKALLFKKTR